SLRAQLELAITGGHEVFYSVCRSALGITCGRGRSIAPDPNNAALSTARIKDRSPSFVRSQREGGCLFSLVSAEAVDSSPRWASIATSAELLPSFRAEVASFRARL